MFTSEMNIIKAGLSDWIGNGMYITLYIISLIYLLFKAKDKKQNNKCIFGYSAIAILFIICNPIFTILVKSVFNYDVYWRLFWIIPIGITMAYSGADFILSNSAKKNRIIIFIGIIVCIIFSGKLIFSNENYQNYNNPYKIPDEILEITNLILKDKGEYKKVLLPMECTPYIRQVTSKIDLMYERNPSGYDGYDIVTEYEKGNVEYIANICKDVKCNYIVMRKSIEVDDSFSNYGYDYFAETDRYIIVKTQFLNKNK